MTTARPAAIGDHFELAEAPDGPTWLPVAWEPGSNTWVRVDLRERRAYLGGRDEVYPVGTVAVWRGHDGGGWSAVGMGSQRTLPEPEVVESLYAQQPSPPDADDEGLSAVERDFVAQFGVTPSQAIEAARRESIPDPVAPGTDWLEGMQQRSIQMTAEDFERVAEQQQRITEVISLDEHERRVLDPVVQRPESMVRGSFATQPRPWDPRPGETPMQAEQRFLAEHALPPPTAFVDSALRGEDPTVPEPSIAEQVERARAILRRVAVRLAEQD